MVFIINGRHALMVVASSLRPALSIFSVGRAAAPVTASCCDNRRQTVHRRIMRKTGQTGRGNPNSSAMTPDTARSFRVVNHQRRRLNLDLRAAIKSNDRQTCEVAHLFAQPSLSDFPRVHFAPQCRKRHEFIRSIWLAMVSAS